jgi:hypothetical protein
MSNETLPEIDRGRSLARTSVRPKSQKLYRLRRPISVNVPTPFADHASCERWYSATAYSRSTPSCSGHDSLIGGKVYAYDRGGGLARFFLS